MSSRSRAFWERSPLGRRGRRSLRRGYEQHPLANAAICRKCGQDTSSPNTKYYFGHPQYSMTEEEALVMFHNLCGDIEPVEITNYTIYCVEGHLCSLGMMENRAELFISGHLVLEGEEVYIPVRDIGPVLKWFVRDDRYIVYTYESPYVLLFPDTKYSLDFGERQTGTKTKSTESSKSDMDRLIQSFRKLKSK